MPLEEDKIIKQIAEVLSFDEEKEEEAQYTEVFKKIFGDDAQEQDS